MENSDHSTTASHPLSAVGAGIDEDQAAVEAANESPSRRGTIHVGWRLHGDWSSVGELEGEWESLGGRAVNDQPTLSPAWVRRWWQVFGPCDGRRLQLLTFHAGEGPKPRLVGVAPLLWRQVRHRAGILLRRLELIGSGEREVDETCSEYIGVLVEQGLEAHVAQALTRVLLDSDELATWDDLRMPAMDGRCPMTAAIRAALSRRGLEVQTVDEGCCQHIPLPGSFDEYLAQLKGSERYLIRRSQRDLERFADGTLSYGRVEGNAALERGRTVLRELHAQRWAGVRPGGAFGSSLFDRFHREVMGDLLERGALDLCWAEAHGQPLAVLYNIRWNNRIYYYQSGRRTDLPNNLRPGIALHAHAIERAIDEGLEDYDFLGGDARFKRQLATAERPLVCLQVTRPTVATRASKLADLGIAGARWLRQATAPLGG